jgi:hypothetical protein
VLVGGGYMELWVRREHPLYNMRHLASQRNPRRYYVMFNPLSNAKVEIVRACAACTPGGAVNMANTIQRGAARRAFFFFFFKHIAADFRHTSQPRENRNFATRSTSTPRSRRYAMDSDCSQQRS